MKNKKDNADVKRWITFAEEDLKAADATLENEVYSAVCFHAQQAVEKSIKALLLVTSGYVPRQHSILRLAEISENKDLFTSHREKLEFLDKFYVPTRYPDALPGSLPEGLPGKEDAEQALAAAREIMNVVKDALSTTPS